MTRDDAMLKIRDALRITFRDPAIEVTRETTADDIDGWDSLSHAILVFRLEKTCNVGIPKEEATSFKDVGALADQIVRLTDRGGK